MDSNNNEYYEKTNRKIIMNGRQYETFIPYRII